MMLAWQGFEVLTFDCYGTFIDWQAGILGALCPVLKAYRVELSDAEILNLYAELEPQAQQPPYRSYREVLETVVAGFGARLGFTPTAAERASLHESLHEWPPFPDTVDALRALKQRYRLAVISNTDDELFAQTANRLGVEFDWIVTAQQVRAYKPAAAMFNEALARIGLPRERVLHVAESLYHDIAPARALGLTTVWVNRARGAAAADLEVPDLKTLAKLAQVI